jgi:hypothetical protein
MKLLDYGNKKKISKLKFNQKIKIKKNISKNIFIFLMLFQD